MSPAHASRATLVALLLGSCTQQLAITEVDPCADEKGAFHIVGPARIDRSTGTPEVEQFAFHVPFATHACVSIVNGVADPPHGDRISSAELRIDGQVIVGPEAFDQKTGSATGRLRVAAGEHVLTVRARSAPGAFFVFKMYGRLALDPAPFRDPEVAYASARVAAAALGTVASVQGRYTFSNAGAGPKTLVVVPTQALYHAARNRVASSWSAAPRNVTEGMATLAQAPSTTVVLAPGETREVTLSWEVPVDEAAAASLRVDPTLLVNGAILARAPAQWQVTLTLPPAASDLAFSSSEPVSESRVASGELVYTWAGTGTYLAPLTAAFTTVPRDVELVKTARREGHNGIVEITITNVGTEPVAQLYVEDVYTWGSVDPNAELLNPEFAFRDTTYSEGSHAWIKQLGTLAVGEARTVAYWVPLTEFAREIPPTRAFAPTPDDELGNIPRLLETSAAVPLPPPVVAPLPWQLAVYPRGWSFDFTDDDHELDQHSLLLWGLTRDDSSGADDDQRTWDWHVTVAYADGNRDDDYRWSVDHGFIGLKGAFVSRQLYQLVPGEHVKQSTHHGSMQSDLLKGYQTATVLLSGWSLNFANGEHHINRIKVSIPAIDYDPATGTVSWRVDSMFYDKNADDPYTWGYAYQVIAFNDGAVRYHDVSCPGPVTGPQLVPDSVQDPALHHLNVAVVPIGFNFDFVGDEDHHINEHSAAVLNVQHERDTVSWISSLSYADKNADDPYWCGMRVAIIAYDDGLGGGRPEAPVLSTGGAMTVTYSAAPGTVLQRETWADGLMNGTETGVDCGGAAPSSCFSCLLDAVDPGDAADADLYSLEGDDLATVLSAAHAALAQKAEDNHEAAEVYYGDHRAQDRYVEAIHSHVAKDTVMKYASDSWYENASSAAETLEGGDCGGAAYCGDCEDYSILQAALLRSVGFSHRCIFSVDHHAGYDQGQGVCPKTKKKKSGGHTFNVVYYQGKFRVMDQKELATATLANCWEQHAVDNVWNDHYGEFWMDIVDEVHNLSPLDGNLLQNYPGTYSCPTGTWNWRNYYRDVCR